MHGQPLTGDAKWQMLMGRNWVTSREDKTRRGHANKWNLQQTKVSIWFPLPFNFLQCVVPFRMGLTGPVLLEREGNAKMMFQVHSTLSARNWPGQNISRTSKEVQEKTQNPHGYQQKVKNVPGLSDGWQAARWSKVERGHVQVAQEKMKWESGWELILTGRCLPRQGNIEKHEVQAHTAAYDSLDTSAQLCGWWQEHGITKHDTSHLLLMCISTVTSCKNMQKHQQKRAAVISVPFHCKISSISEKFVGWSLNGAGFKIRKCGKMSQTFGFSWKLSGKTRVEKCVGKCIKSW